jgi:hypothetical protein
MAADQFHNRHGTHEEKEYPRKIPGMFNNLMIYLFFIGRAGDIHGPAHYAGEERGRCFIDFYPVFTGNTAVAETEEYYNSGHHMDFCSSHAAVNSRDMQKFKSLYNVSCNNRHGKIVVYHDFWMHLERYQLEHGNYERGNENNTVR